MNSTKEQLLRRFCAGTPNLENVPETFLEDLAHLQAVDIYFNNLRAVKVFGSYAALYSTLPHAKDVSPIQVSYPGGSLDKIFEALKQSGRLPTPTAFTMAGGIYFHHGFLATLTQVGKLFVTAHELGHMARRHLLRQGQRDPGLFNIIGDLLINRGLLLHSIPALYSTPSQFRVEHLFTAPEHILGIGLTDSTRHWLTLYSDYCEEEIYFEFEKKSLLGLKNPLSSDHNQENAPGTAMPAGAAGSGAGGSGDGQPPSDFDDLMDDKESEVPQASNSDTVLEGEEPQTPQAGDGHELSQEELEAILNDLYGEIEANEILKDAGLSTDKTRNELEDEANKRIKVARNLSETYLERNQNGKESFPGKHIDDFMRFSDAVDHRYQFALQFRAHSENLARVSSQGKRSVDEDTPDELSELSIDPTFREMIGLKNQFYQGSVVKKEGVADFLHIVDCSGSVSDKERSLFISVIASISKKSAINNTIVTADTVGRDSIYIPHNKEKKFPSELTLGGGGGTDMLTPLAEEIATSKKKYNYATILSDGEFFMFGYDELARRVRELGGKESNIPPLAVMVSQNNIFSREMRKVVDSWPRGKIHLFFIPEAAEMHVTVDIQKERAVLVNGPSL